MKQLSATIFTCQSVPTSLNYLAEVLLDLSFEHLNMLWTRLCPNLYAAVAKLFRMPGSTLSLNVAGQISFRQH